MADTTAITTIDLPSLTKIAHGKVRDLFSLDDAHLLFVASDRISAFDVVLSNGIPHKGAILTLASARWFALLTERLPGLRTHFVALGAPGPGAGPGASAALGLTDAERALLKHRSMQVRRYKVYPLEAIVRGYLAGSGWAEYKRSGTVHGIPLPAGLQLGSRLPSPLYTPSTKAEAGQHDENIHPDEAARLVGPKHAERIAELAVRIYETAAAYALERGIIIADTKFEFGLDETTDEVVLIDEVLTPDSSRFWPADGHEPGREPESFDKQPLRDWLVREGLKGKEGVVMPEEVWRAAAGRYKDVYERLWGKKFDDELTS